jgi:hypothetical protein
VATRVAIDDREVLIGEGLPDSPGGLKVGRKDSFNAYWPAPNSIPESLCCMMMIAAIEQKPGFHKDVIGCRVACSGDQRRFGSAVISIPRYDRGEPDR